MNVATGYGAGCLVGAFCTACDRCGGTSQLGTFIELTIIGSAMLCIGIFVELRRGS